MSSRDFEEVLGAMRSAASRDALGDLLSTLMTREEVEEMAERLEAVRRVLGERARVFVPSPERRLTYLAPDPAEVAGVLADAPRWGAMGDGGGADVTGSAGDRDDVRAGNAGAEETGGGEDAGYGSGGADAGDAGGAEKNHRERGETTTGIGGI